MSDLLHSVQDPTSDRTGNPGEGVKTLEEYYDDTQGQDSLFGEGMPPPQTGMPQNPYAPQPQAPPPVITIPKREFVELTPEMSDEAEKYVKAWCKHSAEYVEKKADDWKLYEDLYYNRRPIDKWHLSITDDPNLLRVRNKINASTADKKNRWRARNVIATSPFIDSYVENLHNAVFSTDEYFLVKPKPKKDTGSIEDPQFPTSKKLQTLLVNLSNELHFPTRTEEALRKAAIFGTVVGKTRWESDEEQLVTVDLITGETLPGQGSQRNVYRQGVDVQLINLTRFLPDPDARNSDVQLWSGVGNRANVPYTEIRKRILDGIYDLNTERFFEQWPESGGSLSNVDAKVLKIEDDADRKTLTDSPISSLQIWEWHGRICFSDHPQDSFESVVTIVTGIEDDDPHSGVMIRCQLEPALSIRLRPYLVHHCIPEPGPLGLGLIEKNIDIIWQISQAENLFLDCCRFVSAPLATGIESAPFWNDARKDEDGNLIFPGNVLKVRKHDDLSPFSLAAADLASIQNFIAMKKKELQERTAVSDISRGVQGSERKTATESNWLMMQAQRPLGTRLRAFADAFLRPYGVIALSMFQREIIEDQTIWMKGQNGTPEPVMLSVDEIRTGEYEVVPALDIPDNARISKAQTIINVIPLLIQNEQRLLMIENKRITIGGLVEELLRLVDVNDLARVISDVDPVTKQQLLMTMMFPAGPPPPAGPGGPPPQENPNPQEGPLGPGQDDQNKQMAEMQQIGEQHSPLPLGGQMGP